MNWETRFWDKEKWLLTESQYSEKIADSWPKESSLFKVEFKLLLCQGWGKQEEFKVRKWQMITNIWVPAGAQEGLWKHFVLGKLTLIEVSLITMVLQNSIRQMLMFLIQPLNTCGKWGGGPEWKTGKIWGSNKDSSYTHWLRKITSISNSHSALPWPGSWGSVMNKS